MESPLNPPPNLYLLGPPRTGTTSLSRWLAATPLVAVSRPKEPAYHALDLAMNNRVADRDEYLQLFAEDGDARYRCDATPWYLFSTEAAASIHKMSPNAKLIVRLRNPADMLASLHTHHRYVGLEPEQDFERAVFGSRPVRSSDFRTNLDYLAVGHIGEQVRRYTDLFPPEQILFTRFEDSRRDPVAAHGALIEWLGLEHKPLDRYETLNRGRRQRLTAVRPMTDWMVGADRPRTLRAFGRRIAAANTVTATNPMSSGLRGRILDSLRDDIALLGDLSGHDVASWWL